ncbi:hypothetical protein BVRB_5g120490 isoform C [Beta vulgaris subsp. vulgaris]|nr:hypothetical protein BVRB_5g120490 isoform C [Beta vulgaris subsp. vulgaris]
MFCLDDQKLDNSGSYVDACRILIHTLAFRALSFCVIRKNLVGPLLGISMELFVLLTISTFLIPLSEDLAHQT